MSATAARTLSPHLTRAALAADVRGWYPATHELALRINDVYVRVATNAPELHHKLSRYFGGFLTPDVPEHGVPAGADAKAIEAAALAEPNVARHLEEVTVRKVVVIPGKLVNVVVG